jgi:hypothetical protein
VNDVGNQRLIKLFIVLFGCTAFIYSFSHFGAMAFETFTSDHDGFAAGTTIGNVDVSGKSADEARALLAERVTKWNSETSIKLQYKEKNAEVDASQFRFDIDKSVEKAVDGQKNDVVVTFKSGDLYQTVKSISSDLDSSKLEMDPIKSELLGYASDLKSGAFQIKLDKFLVATENNDGVISEAMIKPEYIPIDLGLMVEELSPIKIEPQSQVSLLKLIQENNLTALPSEGASMIAAALYQAILPSNFKIVEKHTGQILPQYVNLGMEAKVDFANHLDFVFGNPNDLSYEIELQLNDSVLTASLKGSSLLYGYKISFAEKKEYSPKTIIQYSPTLASAGERIQENGAKGQFIRVYREVYGENDAWLGKELITEDFYPPIHSIKLRGLTALETNPDSIAPGGQSGTNPETQQPGQTNQGTENGAGTITPPATPGEEDDGLYGKPNETLK